MSKLTLARKLADELGTTVQHARRYIDDVGAATARETAEKTARYGSRRSGNWLRNSALLAGTGTAGAGVLKYREQDVQNAKAQAEQDESKKETTKYIVESELPPALKKELLRELYNDGNADPDGGLPDLPDLGAMDQIGLVIGLVIVLALVLNFSLK